MKKALIITYHFPPEGQVAGLRPYAWARHLKKFDWEPIILTVCREQNLREQYKSEFKIIETEPFDSFVFFKEQFLRMSNQNEKSEGPKFFQNKNKFIIYLKHVFKAFMAFPDRHIGWYPIAVKKAETLLAAVNIDLVLSTSMPWTAALIARKVSKKYQVPWIADLQDLWSQYHHYEFGKLRQFFDRGLEKWTLKRARCLIIVSDERAKRLSQIHKASKIRAITLGYDQELFESCTVKPITNCFVITYAGKIKGKQDPEPLLVAISELITEGKVEREFIRLNVWGEVEESFHRLVERYRLQGIVSVFNRVPRIELIMRLKESALLLNLNWNDPQEPGVHHGKLFDYLGAQRPVLAIGKYKDVVSLLLDETGVGCQFFDKEDLKIYLFNCISELKQTGKLMYRGDQNKVNVYSDSEITRKFALLMDEVVRES